MTTADFIAKTFNTTNDKWGRYGYERRCSSVFTDRDGNVYSYGYHYPLLFTIGGLTFINTTGYSSTTAKQHDTSQSYSHSSTSACSQSRVVPSQYHPTLVTRPGIIQHNTIRSGHMPKVNKQAVETAKTVVIAVLITAIVAFIGGMRYAEHQEARVTKAAKSTTAVVAAPAAEVKK